MPNNDEHIEGCECPACQADYARTVAADIERNGPYPTEPVPVAEPEPTSECQTCFRTSERFPNTEFRARTSCDNMVLCNYCACSHSWCEVGEHYGPWPQAYEVVGATAGSMCENCFENQGYHYCDYCECTFANDWPFPDGHICESCWENSGDGEDYYEEDGDQRYVMNYTYRPSLNFNRMEDDKDNFYMGLELETDGINVYGVSREVDNSQPQLFCKSDASLYSGVEIVTHPGTLAAWQEGKVIDWNKWGDVAVLCPGMSDQVRAGIHIHVSRTAFERKGKWSAAHMWKFMQLHYRNEIAFTSLAGRDSTGYAEWQPVSDREGILHDVKNDGAYADRHRAININNRNTIELRYFQADERQEVLLQHIELIHAAVEYTRATTAKEVKEGALDFSKFRSWVSSKPEVYPNLRKAMNRRVADGIIIANRNRTDTQNAQLKIRKDAERAVLEVRRQWFRQMGMAPLQPGEYISFSDYPRAYSMDDIRLILSSPHAYIRYVASITSNAITFIETVAQQLTDHYSRTMVRAAGRDLYYMTAEDWRIAQSYAAAQVVIASLETYNLELTQEEAEGIVNRVAGIPVS